jgi:hypothetical protein
MLPREKRPDSLVASGGRSSSSSSIDAFSPRDDHMHMKPTTCVMMQDHEIVVPGIGAMGAGILPA